MDESIADSWEIEVKVINKSQIKEYRGGRLFKVDLQDDLYRDDPQSQGKAFQIEATSFKETLDKFYPVFKKGKYYRISQASIYVANKKFTQLNNDFRLILNDEAIVTEVEPTTLGHQKNKAS